MEGALGGKGGGKGIRGGGKGGAEGIADGLEHHAVVVLDGLAQQRVVAGEGHAHGFRVFFPESGGAFDVGKRNVTVPLGRGMAGLQLPYIGRRKVRHEDWLLLPEGARITSKDVS